MTKTSNFDYIFVQLDIMIIYQWLFYQLVTIISGLIIQIESRHELLAQIFIFFIRISLKIVLQCTPHLFGTSSC